MKLRRLATRDAGFEAELAGLTRDAALQDPALQESVRAILADVRVRGDEAVLEYTRKFDRSAARSLAELEVPREELQRALQALPGAQAQALREARERIREFHQRQLQSSCRAPGSTPTRTARALASA
jgi:histidinol dehydrogenase